MVWKGSMWMDGQCTRGVACDCIGFVQGVLDNLFGSHMNDRPSVTRFAAFTNKHQGLKVARWLRDRYNSVPVTDGVVEPGDIIVSKVSSCGNEGHIYIVGPDRNTVWHCLDPNGVDVTGLGNLVNVTRAWRTLDKGLWV